MRYHDADHAKFIAEKQNQLNFAEKKLYEYPGGNKVDGLPPMSSETEMQKYQMPGDPKLVFWEFSWIGFGLNCHEVVQDIISYSGLYWLVTYEDVELDRSICKQTSSGHLV